MSATPLDITAMQAAYESAMMGQDVPGIMVVPATDANLWRFCPWIMLRRSRELKLGKYRRWLA
jgi:hypothetical protein